MITRKTRLTSALLAVLMLTTMLAAYVLPATAEESSPYPLLRDMETLGRDYTDDWGIATAEDWVAAVELSKESETFNGKTLHLTADIDFDVDEDGQSDPEEYVSPLGLGEGGFAGNIHGHGYVLENIFVDHDIAEGPYAALIARGSKSGQVVRDLGIASGKINVHGKRGLDYASPDKMAYAGAFVSYAGGGMIFANCWNAAEVYAEVEVYEIDMAPFGRMSSATLINCINMGNMTSINNGEVTKEGAPSTPVSRTDALLDWTNDASVFYNCVNVGILTGSQKYVVSTGSGVDNKDATQCAKFAANFHNVHVYAQSGVSLTNKSAVNKNLPADLTIDMGQYDTGELACMLNDNYDSTNDSVYGRKYFKMENGRLVMTDDSYEALYKLTVTKQIGDYVISSNVSYVNATTAVDLPSFEGYELASHSDAIMPDYENNIFRMPPENAELNYQASVPDWSIIEGLIAKYKDMVESGHVKAMKDSAAISELLDKLQLSYANKDNMSDEQAMARIALYVKDDANLDLSLKTDLVYPNYPLMRYYEKGASKVWGIKSEEDWRKAVSLSNTEGEDFEGVTIHFLADIDMGNVPVDPLCMNNLPFEGTIDGHGHVIKRLKIERTITAAGQCVGLIGYMVSDNVKVIRDLGIESGLIATNSSTGVEPYTGAFSGYNQNTYFINCWNGADVLVYTEEGKKGSGSASVFGRIATGTTGGLINCFNVGKITESSSSHYRVSIADWVKSPLAVINTFNAGKLSADRSGSTPIITGINYHTEARYNSATIENFYVTNATSSVAIGGTHADVGEEGWLLKDGAEATGELAWKINNGYVDPTPYLPEGVTDVDRHYFTVKNGTVAYGTVTEQPVRVTVKIGDKEVYYYGMTGDKINLAELFSMGNPTFRVVETYAASIDSANVLTINSLPNGLDLTVNATFDGGLDYLALIDAVESYDGVSNLDKYTSNITTTKLSDKLAEVQSKTYTIQDEIDADVEILESYYLAVSITEYNANPDADTYTVASKSDMEYLAGICTKLTADQTIIITADIDMKNTGTSLSGIVASIEGNGHTIENLKLSGNSWLGNYTGKSVSNLTIKNSSVSVTKSGHAFLISQVTTPIELTNIKFDNVTSTVTGIGTGSGGIQGVMIGSVSGGTLNAKNLTVVNSTLNRPTGGGSKYWNSGIIFGKTYKGTINIDGIYLNGNTTSCDRTGSGQGIAFGEIICDATIKNVVVTNTTVNDIKSAGVFSMVKEGGASTNNPVDPKIHIENVITYNNGNSGICISTDANAGKGTTIKNIYTDAEKVVSKTHDSIVVTNGNAEADTAIKSGEAAYVLNSAEPEMTWVMKNDLPAPGKTGLPVKVTLDLLVGEDVVLYTDVNGKLIGLTNELAAKFWNGYTDLANAVFTEDTTVVQSDCNHDWTCTSNGDGTHTLTCNTPNGCGDVKTVDCDLTYEVIDGVTHTVKCAECGYNTAESCNKEVTHVYGTYEAESKHVVVCADCGHSAEIACDFAEERVAHTNLYKGYTKYTCDCGYSYKVEETEKAHVFDDNGVVVKAPSYTEEGSSKHKCTICDAYEYRTIPALTGTGINVNAPVSAMQGEEITVDIELANNQGNIAGLNLQVVYDTATFELVKVQDNGIFDLDVQPETQTPGEINLTYANAGNVTAGETDGKALTTITFKVLDNAAYGSTEIVAKLVKGDEPGDTGAVDYNSNFVEVKDGSTVTEIMKLLWGDANMDGDVNVADATTILQWKVGMDVTIDLVAADADRNGEVGISDALMLLQYENQLVEWDPNGTTPEPASQN